LDSSSGSSGFIKSFYHSPSYFALHVPEVYWADSLAGWRPGTRRAKLWGAGKDIKQAQRTYNRVKSWLRNDRLFDSFIMSDHTMRKYHEQLTHFGPEIMVAYAGSAFQFARFLQDNNLAPEYPKTSIICSAEPLTPSMRDAIQGVFGCPVFDRYGSREVGVTACECEAHDGLHIVTLRSYVEVVRPGTTTRVWDEEGDVLITTLGEPDVPLIRYQIGDTAVASRDRCVCGRTSPMLKMIKGKTPDFVKTPDGRHIYGDCFAHMIYGMPHIRRFLVIQESLIHVALKLVAVRPLSELERRNVLADFKDVLGTGVTVDIEEVEKLPPLPSGKHRFILSEVLDE
jgi:phenylacetate-CoA ligase